MASIATKEEILEAEDLTETTVKFVQIKEITATPLTMVSTANALIVTNAAIPKRTASSSKTTKHVLDTNLKIPVCKQNIHQTETTERIIPLNPVPTVNTIYS